MMNMELRYGVGETTLRQTKFAAVVDHGRDGEVFCLVDPRECFGGMETAQARAQDIAALFNGAAISGAIVEIAAERRRQVEAEGWTPEHDAEHSTGEMAQAAACYAMGDHRIIAWSRDGKNRGEASLWPWHRDWWKPADRRRNLVKAGALIAAEIDRMDAARVPA